jgi:hypothetical protein
MDDIRNYTYQELSYLFLNNEFLYKVFMRAVRETDFTIIKELCDKHFIYNKEQLEDLADVFNDELTEYEQQ